MGLTRDMAQGYLRLPGWFAAILFIGIQVATAADAPREVRDLHYGEVLFHFYQDDYFPAITHLLAAEKQARMPNHETDARLLLGGMELSYGMNREATAVFEELLEKNAGEPLRNHIWFYLGRIDYQRGYLKESEDALARVTNKVPRVVRARKELLYAQVLMRQGRYQEAVEELQGWKGPGKLAGYADYNLGVALIRSGNEEAGIRQLADVGKLGRKGAESYGLRDKANLTLGLHLLRQEQPALARQYLNRVRLTGPFANLALLGAGWADSQAGLPESALVPWNELLRRTVADPPVQEALVAFPGVLLEMDAQAEATEQYRRAIELLTEEGERLDYAINNIDSVLFPGASDGGVFVQTGILQQTLMVGGPTIYRPSGHRTDVDGLSVSPEAIYLEQLLALHDFQEAWKNYHDLQHLVGNLAYWGEQIETFDDMLATRKAAYKTRMPRVLAAQQSLDPENMRERWYRLNQRIDKLESENDYLALATTGEGQQWQKLESLRERIARLPSDTRTDQIREKQRLLQGVLGWQLNAAYKDRLWAARSELKALNDPLDEARQGRAALDRAMHGSTYQFDGYGDQIKALRTRIEVLQPRLNDALARQGKAIRMLAMRELEQRKKNLRRYVLQARFALATTYDQTADGGGAP